MEDMIICYAVSIITSGLLETKWMGKESKSFYSWRKLSPSFLVFPYSTRFFIIKKFSIPSRLSVQHRLIQVPVRNIEGLKTLSSFRSTFYRLTRNLRWYVSSKSTLSPNWALSNEITPWIFFLPSPLSYNFFISSSSPRKEGKILKR